MDEERERRILAGFRENAEEAMRLKREKGDLKRHNSQLQRSVAHLTARLKEEKARRRQQAREPARLRNRIITLRAKNYQLKQQLAETEAFLSTSET